MRYGSWLGGLGLAWCAAIGACASPGGGAGATPSDVTNAAGDTTSATGTTATATTAPTDTTVVDTQDPTVADTTPTDTTTVCTPACIPLAHTTANVAFQQNDAYTEPPSLGGSTPAGVRPDGTWLLHEVDVYPYGTFADGISVTIENHGATTGHAAFQGGLFMLGLDLDLTVTVDVGGSVGSDSAKATVALGGCNDFDGAWLTGDFDHCADGFPDGTSAPSDVEYAFQGNALSLSVTITRDMLIAMLPPDKQDAAQYAIVGDMTFIAKFTH